MNDRAAWLEERRSGIGGSDAAAVLGLSKWKTPLEVYMDKRGEGGEQMDNESMLWGRVLEAPIRQQYAERTGRVVRVPEGILRHPQHAFMLANLDGVTDDGRLLEVKTARTGMEWGEPGSDEVPQAYLIQVQHYLSVTALPVADVAVLIGGADFRLYEISADPELQQMIIDGEASFWQRVEQGIPPEPVSFADVQARFGRSSRQANVEASAEVMESIGQIRAAKAEIELLEAAVEQHKAVVMKALGDCDTLVHSGFTVATWKAAKPAQRFDAKALQAARPEIYQQFLKTGEVSRRFLIK